MEKVMTTSPSFPGTTHASTQTHANIRKRTHVNTHRERRRGRGEGEERERDPHKQSLTFTPIRCKPTSPQVFLQVASRTVMLAAPRLARTLHIHPQTVQLQMFLEKRAMHHRITVPVIRTHYKDLIQ